jgi:hypothetical protein
MVVFKDTDEKDIQVALDNYKRYLDGLCHELDNETFYEANKDSGFFTVDGISKEELYVFRDEAIKYNMDYTIVPSKSYPDKYMIQANNRDFLDSAVNDMLYIVSGPDGHDYVDKIKKYEMSQSDTYNHLATMSNGKNPTYIVDSDNPARILMLQNGGYSTHLIKMVEDELSGRLIAIDKEHKEIKVMNDSIINEVNNMSNPVIITNPNDLPFVSGKDNQGALILSDDFDNKNYVKQIRNNLENFPSVVVRHPKHNKEMLLEEGNLKLYTNLPYIVIREINKANIDGVYVSGKDIAYLPEAEQQIQEIFDKYLYNDVSPITKIERNLKYQGRGECKLKDLSPEETYYIIDAASPGLMLQVDSEGYNMNIGKNQMVHKEAGSPDYEASITEFVQAMAVPVVLTGKEYGDLEKQRIIKSKINHPEDNKAYQYVQQLDEYEREELNRYINLPSEQLTVDVLSDTQKEVIARKKEMEIEYHHHDDKDKTINKEHSKKDKSKNRDDDLDR